MFASFKKLFAKNNEGLAISIPEAGSRATTAFDTTFSKRTVTPSFSTETPSLPATTPAPAPSVDIVSLPLKSIFARLPQSLSSVVQSQGNGFLSLPAQRILQELPKGSVKISFGEVRQAAPSGTFFSISNHDNVLVELPLNEILLRLHPSLLARRQNQNKIILSDEVTNVFGPRGEGISVSRKPAPSAKPFTAPPISAIVEPLAPIVMPKPAMPEVPRHTPIPMPTISLSAAPASHVVSTETATRINFAESVLNLSLASISEDWPDAVRQEIREFSFASVNVALPIERIELALRSGKISFSWKQIRGWMKPSANYPSSNEDAVLELPLKIVAPLFLQNHRPSKAQKKISVEEFPDLFAIKTAAPALKIVEVPAAIVPEPVEIKPAPVAAPAIAPSIPGEFFGQPAKHDWSPNEVVKGVGEFPGVAGVFIAMNDGLLVAAQLPAQFKADHVAAFLPQIFGRMNQYAKELQIGSVSSLNFVADNLSWQIVKQGAVFLVAVAKSGESLPESKLKTIAAELGRQIQ